MKNDKMNNNVENNNTEKFTRFCCECGVKFESDKKNGRICPACAEKKQRENLRKAAEKTKAKHKELGLVAVYIRSTDRDAIKEYGKANGRAFADAVTSLVATLNESALASAEESNANEKSTAKPTAKKK